MARSRSRKVADLVGGSEQVDAGLLISSPNTSLDYQGINLRNTKDSSVVTTTSFVDAQNNLGVPDSHLFFTHYTDGSSEASIGTTPAGDRTVDRRGKVLSVKSSGVEITGSITNAGAIIGTGAQSLTLKPGTSDHTYIGWCPRSSAPTSRAAYAGFGGAGSTNFTVNNEIGDVTFSAAEFFRFNSRWGSSANITVYPGIPSNTSIYTHVKTTQHYTSAHMTMWKCEGYRAYSENVVSTFGCYTYPDAPSAPYLMQIQRLHGGSNGFVNGYYSSDGYLVLVVSWPTNYTSFALTHYATNGPYGGKGATGIIAVTGSNSTTGAF